MNNPNDVAIPVTNPVYSNGTFTPRYIAYPYITVKQNTDHAAIQNFADFISSPFNVGWQRGENCQPYKKLTTNACILL